MATGKTNEQLDLLSPGADPGSLIMRVRDKQLGKDFRVPYTTIVGSVDNRGPNNRPAAVKIVGTLAQMRALDPLACCLETECIVQVPASRYVLRYADHSVAWDYVCKDGTFNTADLADADWFAVDSPQAGYPTWAELQTAPPAADHVFAIDDIVRDYAGGSTEGFYKAKRAAVLPRPTTPLVATDWEEVSGSDLPMPTRLAWENIQGVPSDSPALEEYVDARLFPYAERLSAIEGGAARYVAHRADGTFDATFTTLRAATDWMGAGGYTLLNRPEGLPLGQNILLGSGSTLDLQGHPLNLGGHDLHLYSGAQVRNNRLIYNGRIFLREGIDPARPQLIQGGVVAGQLYQQTGIAEAVTLDGVIVTDFGQGGAATAGAFTVTLRNGARFFDYNPAPATTVVELPGTNEDIEITDVTKGVIMTVGPKRVRAQLTGTTGAYNWAFTEL